MADQTFTLPTKQDARTWYTNSGVVDWEWFPSFTPESLIDFAYKTSGQYETQNQMLAAFLRSNGENPDDYGIR